MNNDPASKRGQPPAPHVGHAYGDLGRFGTGTPRSQLQRQHLAWPGNDLWRENGLRQLNGIIRPVPWQCFPPGWHEGIKEVAAAVTPEFQNRVPFRDRWS